MIIDANVNGDMEGWLTNPGQDNNQVGCERIADQSRQLSFNRNENYKTLANSREV
jgi:hypothetical protein